MALTDLVKSQLPPAVLTDLVARGFPTVEECAEAALRLVAEDAPNGQFVMMDFDKRPIEDPSQSSEPASKELSPGAASVNSGA